MSESDLPFIDHLGLVGERLGPYVVREVVAAGGVAMIYRAEHEALRNVVAVKVLTPELVDSSARPTLEQMFLREAQILGQLRSDDILRAVDHGRVRCPSDGAERPYIVVDWLEGKPLSDEIDERRRRPPRPYTLGEAIELLEPIARALAACHASGIVHRDVNPRNVFLERMPSGPPRAKLIDFGFAKEVARTEALRLEQVSGTLFARSPDYAAPEHYDREQYGELSENTDIYTFALMLVEMLTLAPPLRGITDADLGEATSNRDDRPTPNNRGAHVPDAVERVFAEALAVDQFERPGDIMDFWERLKEASAESGPHGEPAVVSERPAAPTRRGRGWIVALAGLAALGGAGLFVWLSRPLDCAPGTADCNGDRGDGCEAELSTNAAHCGACGAACPASGVDCVAGACRVVACPEAHLRDCNQSAGDLCEVDVRTDIENCGECGGVCGKDGAKSVACVASKCRYTCEPGRGDCDGASESGCEKNLLLDPQNCGKCGTVCGDAACVQGLCEPTAVLENVAASHLVAQGGDLYFWDAESRRIERLAPGGKPEVLVEGVGSLTGLAVGTHRVAWATAGKNEIFARALGAEDAPVRRIAGPLTGETPLSFTESGYLSWASRPRAVPAAASRGKRGRAASRVPKNQRLVHTAPLDAVLDDSHLVSSECDRLPTTFVGDAEAQFCCEASQPLARIECQNGACTHRAYDAICPEDLVLVEGTLYFIQDVRVLSLEPESGRLQALSKRKRRPRELSYFDGYLYWLEGEPESEVYRMPTDPGRAGVPELLARGQRKAAYLTASTGGVYWVAANAGAPKAKGSRTIYTSSVR